MDRRKFMQRAALVPATAPLMLAVDPNETKETLQAPAGLTVHTTPDTPIAEIGNTIAVANGQQVTLYPKPVTIITHYDAKA